MDRRFSELREKDVIDVCTGRRVGFLTDCEITPEGRVAALIVSPRFLGSPKTGVRIPWNGICCIGEDAILVRLPEGSSGADGNGRPKPGRGVFGLGG